MRIIRAGFFDDHPIMLQGLVGIFNTFSDFEVVCFGTSAEEALRAAEANTPDLMLLDLSMPGDVLGTVSLLSRAKPNMKIAIFTASTNVDDAVCALQAGASGYLLKGSTARELCSALKQIVDGETYVAPAFATKVIMALKNTSGCSRANLNSREEQIIRLLLKGCTNRKIATHLSISEKTVKHYMTALMQKLNVRNRLEVVRVAHDMMNEIRSPLLQ